MKASTWARESATTRAPGRRVALEDDEVRELGATVAFPERRDCERLEHRPVEADAGRGIADVDLYVVEDDARPVPVDGHGGGRAVSWACVR